MGADVSNVVFQLVGRLKSYKLEELLVKRGGGAGWGFSDEILSQFPDDKRKMGFNWHTMPNDYPALELPRTTPSLLLNWLITSS